jgi:dTDP-4-dehydrorhamnose reductase
VRILVTGHDGLLGSALVPPLRDAGHAVEGFGVEDGDIADAPFVTGRVTAARPDWVLHLAAFTAVDLAESEAAEAERVNVTGTRVAARAAADAGARFLVLSTDYVFDGARTDPYAEDASPHPLSVYGRTKLAAEEEALAAIPGATVVRTAWLFGPGGPNFPDTILRLLGERDTLDVVDDQRGCPTYAPHLARGLVALVEANAGGRYHLAGSGSATWCELARAVAEGAGLDPSRIRSATTADLGRPAPRPPYSVLDCGRAEREHGIRLPDWRDGVRMHLAGRNQP